MEPFMIQYKFFVVTKGKNTCIFTSFDEASKQVVNFSNAEYCAFNCQATAVSAYSARLRSMDAEREELREMGAEFEDPAYSPLGTLRTIATANGRRANLYWTVNAIPPSEAASGNYAINVNMEEWLLRVCYGSSIPPLAFFHNEIGISNNGIHYAFTVVIPGNPLGPHVYAKGRYLQCEEDAREDATFNMVEKILEETGKAIQDYNYIRAIMLAKANTELTHQLERLEKCRTHGYDGSPDLVSL